MNKETYIRQAYYHKDEDMTKHKVECPEMMKLYKVHQKLFSDDAIEFLANGPEREDLQEKMTKHAKDCTDASCTRIYKAYKEYNDKQKENDT